MRTFVITGTELHPHELGENLWRVGFTGGIAVINVDSNTKSAYFHIQTTANNYEKCILGTQAATAALLDPQNDKFIVDLVFDWEYTLFNLRKDTFGVWHAQSPRIKDVDLLLGLSDALTYELISRADKFFISGASDSTLAYEIAR